MLFLVNGSGVPSVAAMVNLPTPGADTTPPSAPGNLVATGGSNSASLTWTASTDNVGVAGYNVYRSATPGFTPGPSTLVGTTTTTSYIDSSLAASGSYSYLVTAQDAAGNVSPPSNQASAPVTVSNLTLGNATAGAQTDTSDAGYMNGSRFSTGAAGGTVSSMSVNVGAVDAAPNNQFQLAIYSDNNGTPGTLLAKSASGTLTANNWNSVPLTAMLNPNTAYWLMYNTNSSSSSLNNVTYDGSSGQQAYSNNGVAFGAWPAGFGSATTGAWAFSIYVTYTLQ